MSHTSRRNYVENLGMKSWIRKIALFTNYGPRIHSSILLPTKEIIMVGRLKIQTQHNVKYKNNSNRMNLGQFEEIIMVLKYLINKI